MITQPRTRVVRFGEYELDLQSSELRKHGHKLPVPDQAVQILAMLLERPGEIVTREQLIARLWPTGTVVEFDHGINSSVRRLRAVLNDSAERPAYIETLPKRGYRFIFPVKKGEVEPALTQADISAAPKESPTRKGDRKWPWLVAGAVLLIILGSFGALRWRSSQGQPINSIAVLPLVNATNDPNAEYLSDGIAEEIINALSTIPDLKVIARTSAFRFKGKEADPRKAGRELGVGAVLTGTLLRRGEDYVIQADLVNVADGSELWGARISRPPADLPSVQAEITPEIANQLRLRLKGDELKQLAKRYTRNSEAYELYL